MLVATAARTNLGQAAEHVRNITSVLQCWRLPVGIDFYEIGAVNKPTVTCDRLNFLSVYGHAVDALDAKRTQLTAAGADPPDKVLSPAPTSEVTIPIRKSMPPCMVSRR